MFDLPEETTVSKEKQNTGNRPLAKVLKTRKQIKVSYTFVILHTTVTMFLPFVLYATPSPSKKKPPTKKPQTKNLKQTPTHNYFLLFSLARKKVLFRLTDS